MNNLIFRYPIYFAGILIIVFFLFLLRFQKKGTLQTSFFGKLRDKKFPAISKKIPFVHLLRFFVLSLIFIALAQPLAPEKEIEYRTKTIDIILAIDISGSMKAEDFQPQNRLAVAKEEAERFIEGRSSDRIGLVIFAAKSFTQCPLTLDHTVLNDLLAKVEIGMIRDGTAIGLAIANGVNRLVASDAKSKVIILLTDGENNSGQVDPLTAAELARAMGVRVYTIGVGRGGLVPYPDDSPVFGKLYKNVRLDVDEDTLKEIAHITNGLYFRAKDQKSLREIYKKIDRLEKTDVTVKEYVQFEQLYQYPLIAAICFLIIEIIFQYYLFMKIP